MQAADLRQLTRCGYVAIVGRANVGKSTLLNKLIRTKLCPVADKPQTTRHNITGILTEGDSQLIFVDTPGVHLGGKKLLNRVLNRSVLSALCGVDILVFVVENHCWRKEEDQVLEGVAEARKACLLCVNKIDVCKEKDSLLPTLAHISQRYAFDAIIPISARTGANLDVLKREIKTRLPQSKFVFENDRVSSRSERFFVSELIREQLVRMTQQELPYSTYVEIDTFQDRGRMIYINATIWVERPGQKAIVIGKEGAALKNMGIRARKSIERFIGKKVFLNLWVKHKAGWQDDPKVIGSFGSEMF